MLKFFEDNGYNDSYICPYCGSCATVNIPVDKDKWESIKERLRQGL